MADTFWATDFWPAGFWADGFWTNEGAPEPPIPDVVIQTPAGKHRRRLLFVQIDGQDFQVRNESEAIALLQQARALAERQVQLKAPNVERRLAKRETVPVVALPKPEISVSAELREATRGLIADIERLYAKASEEMELRLLLAKVQADEDDDEDVLLLS